MAPPDDVARLVRAHFGEAEVRPAGEGGDHVTWRVASDSGAWVVRAPRGATSDEGDGEPGAAARREVAVVDLVRREVGRWAPEAVVLDADAGITACRWVPGTPLQDLLAAGAVGTAETARLGAEIGAFARDIARIDPHASGSDGPVDGIEVDDTPLAEWRDEAFDLLADVAPALDREVVARVEAFLAGDPPPDPDPGALVLAHNDLGAEHVIVDDDLAVVGVIDWSDSAVADPAADLARVLRDLGETGFVRAVAGVGALVDGPEARSALVGRAGYLARCLVVEDLAYALDRRPDLVEHGRRNVERLFSAG